jgi:hypothetical protein
LFNSSAPSGNFAFSWPFTAGRPPCAIITSTQVDLGAGHWSFGIRNSCRTDGVSITPPDNRMAAAHSFRWPGGPFRTLWRPAVPGEGASHRRSLGPLVPTQLNCSRFGTRDFPSHWADTVLAGLRLSSATKLNFGLPRSPQQTIQPSRAPLLVFRGAVQSSGPHRPCYANSLPATRHYICQIRFLVLSATLRMVLPPFLGASTNLLARNGDSFLAPHQPSLSLAGRSFRSMCDI